jgi:hypothetical protein
MKVEKRPVILSNEKIRIGYGADFLPQRAASDSPWRIAFGKPNRAVGNLHAEGVAAARKIGQSSDTTTDVYYSGGLDSEFAVHCFKEAGVDFKVVTVEFSGRRNIHDLEYVQKFKQKNPDLKYRTVQIDIENFLQSQEAEELANISKCTLPHILMLMKIARENKSPLVLSTGEPYLIKAEDGWYLREREAIAALSRFFDAYQIQGTHAFFQSTNEIFYSYLIDPVMQALTAGRYPGKESSLSSRGRLYSQYFDCEERPKYHGYEKISGLIDELQGQLESRYANFRNIHYYLYDELVQKMGDI